MTPPRREWTLGDMEQPEPPLLDGGQGRSGESLEVEAVALALLGVTALALLLICVVAVGVFA